VAPVSAVVVNYNAGDFIDRCLLSLGAQVRELVVVDNASTDGSLERLAALPAPCPLKVIREPSNRGFAAACNDGLAQCVHPYILFLNPDCEVAPGAIRSLVEALSMDPTAGMVGGRLVDPDGQEQGGGRRAVPTPWRSFVRAFGLARFADRWPKLFFDFHLHQQPLPEGPIEVEAISGACVLVRREAVEQVGAWDDGYFLHCEDLDWCMRFRRAGLRILFVPDAVIVHAKGGSSGGRTLFVEWHKHRGMVRFYRKFFRHQYPGALMGLVMVGVWVRFTGVASVSMARRALAFVGRMRG
jgi:GT2 family glycosyltransferase